MNMYQSSCLISKKCNIVSGASRQYFMSKLLVCTHQHEHWHMKRDADLPTQQIETSPQTSHVCEQIHSRMKGRCLREE